MQAQTTEKMRILVVDDQRVVREILCSNLENEPDLEIVGVAADGDEAIDAIDRLQPDVVLLDIVMQDTDGLTATRIITERFPQTKILILSSHDSDEYLSRALRAGAHGYVPKNSGISELVSAIWSVYRGLEDADSLFEGSNESKETVATQSDRDDDELISASLGSSNSGSSSNGRRGSGGFTGSQFTGKDRMLFEDLQRNYNALQGDLQDFRNRYNTIALRLTKLEKQATRNRGTIGVLFVVMLVLAFIILFYSPENFSPDLPEGFNPDLP